MGKGMEMDSRVDVGVQVPLKKPTSVTFHLVLTF